MAVAALAPWAGSRASPLPLGNSRSPPAAGTLPEAMHEGASWKAAIAEGPSSPPWLFPLEGAVPGPGERGCRPPWALSAQAHPSEQPPGAGRDPTSTIHSADLLGVTSHTGTMHAPSMADVTSVSPGVRSWALVLSSFPPLWIVQTPQKRTHSTVPWACTGSQPERYKIHVQGRKGQCPDLV